MRRLMYMKAKQDDVYCILFDYNTAAFAECSFYNFIVEVAGSNIQNFRVIGNKIVCTDSSAKQIFVDYSNPKGRYKYHNVLQNGAFIQYNNRLIQLPKFRQTQDKGINPAKMLHILAKIKDYDGYVVQTNECKVRIIQRTDLENMQQAADSYKLVNAKIVNNHISAIKGQFVVIRYNHDDKQKKQKESIKAEKAELKSWGTLLSYKHFIQSQGREAVSFEKIHNLGFIEQQFSRDFDACYAGQKYQDILVGNNRYIILRYIDKLQVLVNRNADVQIWLDKHMYIDSMHILGCLNSSIQRVYKRIQKDVKHFSESPKWREHYKRTISSLLSCADGLDDTDIVIDILKDCIEYRIKNDKALQNVLKTYADEVKNLLNDNVLMEVIMLALYIDFLYTGNYGRLPVKDQTVFIASALRLNYILHCKSYMQHSQKNTQLIQKIDSDISEITKFISSNTIRKCRNKFYGQQEAEKGSLVTILSGSYAYSQMIYQDRLHFEVVPRRQYTNIQQSMFKYEIDRTYKETVQRDEQIGFKYVDTNNVTWKVDVDPFEATVQSQIGNSCSIDLFTGESLRKVRDGFYIVCGELKHNAKSDYMRSKPEQRLLFLMKRTGKTGKEITDVVYVPMRICQSYQDFRNCADKLSCFNISIEPVTIGNKIYYMVKQNELIICLAPDSQNFNDDYSDLNTDNNLYSDMNTDRPLLFTVFGRGQQYKTFYPPAQYYSDKNAIGNIYKANSYRGEITDDINKLFSQLENTMRYYR